MIRDHTVEWTSVPLAEARENADPNCTSCNGTAIAWESDGYPPLNKAPHKAICRCAGGVCWKVRTTKAP